MNSILYLGCPDGERIETERALAAASVSVVWADNVSYAVSQLQRRDMPIVLDLSRGDAALAHARELKSHSAEPIMFAVVDEQRPDLTMEAVLAGFADVFARPVGGRRVARAIERERAFESREQVRSAPAHVDELYRHSSAMRAVVKLIARAAAMRAGVMIRGESSTGRHTIARTIHGSQPAAGAFVALDFAATDVAQLDGQLFGAPARPATGGAARGLEIVSRGSSIYQARGGTLFLQNVSEAPTRVQARLARLLRDREAVLADGGETVDIDVRPIASVDPGVDAMVQEGRIRDDLFRRLSVIRIDAPSLRNRREDIPALANYFVREICASRHVPPKMLSRSALSLIAALPWRGNAAELRSLLDQVAATAAGRTIALEDVLAQVRLDEGSVVLQAQGTLRQARARFEREYIATVLEQHDGRISEAAKALGIQRTNLYRKMRALRVTCDRRPVFGRRRQKTGQP